MAKVRGSRQESLIVRAHKPGRFWVLVSIGVVFSLVALVTSFYGGRVYERQIQALVPAEKEKFKQLLERSALLDTDSSVDRMALEVARININELEGTIHQLNKEIAFYKSVMAPESAVKGLFVHDMDIEGLPERDGSDAGRYRLSWVLAQAGKNKGFISGNVQIKIHGVSDGEKRVLSLKDVSQEAPNAAFKLRYFQVFEAEIQLPENLTVKKIEVIARSSGKKPQTIVKEFDWVAQRGLENVPE
jgi:hypothetical protein